MSQNGTSDRRYRPKTLQCIPQNPENLFSENKNASKRDIRSPLPPPKRSNASPKNPKTFFPKIRIPQKGTCRSPFAPILCPWSQTCKIGF